MQFKRKMVFSHHKASSHKTIIEADDLMLMMRNEYLLEKQAFHLVKQDFSTTLSEQKNIETAFNTSQTIIIKELENWNASVQEKGRIFGSSPNVHLYLSPSFGTSFDWHADDRDVFILMQKGEKLFEVEEPDFSVSRYLLQEGSELFIPYGARHRAITSDTVSWHLSFGIWPQGLTINDGYLTCEADIKLNL